MAQRGLEVAGLALVIVATAMCALCSAQPTTTGVQPTAVMPNCAPVPISLSPCIGYVMGVGTATLSTCCSQLQAFFQSQGPCLCAMSKLAPSPFGLVLGQVQGMIPNVCNLPSNPCDDDADGASTSPDASTLPVAGATAPAAPLDPTASTAPETTPVATPVTPATTTPTSPDVSGAAPVPADDSPAAVAAPGQAEPEVESSTGSQTASKLPQLLHASGARSSRDKGAGTVLVTLFLVYVSTMYV